MIEFRSDGPLSLNAPFYLRQTLHVITLSRTSMCALVFSGHPYSSFASDADQGKRVGTPRSMHCWKAAGTHENGVAIVIVFKNACTNATLLQKDKLTQ